MVVGYSPTVDIMGLGPVHTSGLRRCYGCPMVLRWTVNRENMVDIKMENYRCKTLHSLFVAEAEQRKVRSEYAKSVWAREIKYLKGIIHNIDKGV